MKKVQIKKYNNKNNKNLSKKIVYRAIIVQKKIKIKIVQINLKINHLAKKN